MVREGEQEEQPYLQGEDRVRRRRRRRKVFIIFCRYGSCPSNINWELAKITINNYNPC